MKTQSPDSNAELLSCNSFSSGIVYWGLAASEKMAKTTFFLFFFVWSDAVEKFGTCYPSHTMREAVNLYMQMHRKLWEIC